MANMGGQFRLTKEESALMDECRKSSFWYRSVPLMAVATGLMTYRRLNGQVPPKFYGFKLAGGIVAAYMMGKLSYIPECRRLILQRLPDSNLAHSLESKPYDLISDMTQPPELVSKSTTNNIFGARHEEDEEQQQINLAPSDPLDKSATQKYVTYDELRQRNRTDHAAKFSGTKVRTDAPAASGTALPAPIQDARSMPPLPIVSTEPPSPSKRSNKRKNQYGDEVYE